MDHHRAGQYPSSHRFPHQPGRDQLVDMGLISRRRLRDDRRVVMLSLTEEGSALTLKLHQKVQEYDSRLVEGIARTNWRNSPM